MQSIFGYRGPPLFAPSSLLSHLPTSLTHLPPPSPSTPSTGEEPPHPFSPAAFVSFQNSLKLKRQKHQQQQGRAPRLPPGGGGVPAAKRKSREGTTTYLWEFLLKLLQVMHLLPDPPQYGP
jgi:hypothetical protein